MLRDRLVQIIAPLVMVVCLGAAGAMLPGILDESQTSALRYTNVVVEGAPPIVAMGTVIGALRGLIVDFLWIKVSWMKEKGLYYEMMADSELITKLQPRFAMVWGFHGHNMAYNVSVATHTQQERWAWVNAGIRLIRDQGLRYNPNDITLHRELAFMFAHKLEGYSDDANLYYKQQFCEEWHLLLGEPPVEHADRIAWMKEIADAPESYSAAVERVPEVAELVDILKDAIPQNQLQIKFELDEQFLGSFVMWQAVAQQSVAARVLGLESQWRNDPFFQVFDQLARDPKYAKAWPVLLAHVRKRVLSDKYNMDPQLMYQYTRDLGPIDWRHGQAHALYWSRRGSQFGEGRVREYDIYVVLNNDSQQLQAMQDLARWGRIAYDPIAREFPGRFPEPRWIDVIDQQFEPFYKKHLNVRGAGGERFINFLKHFLGSAIREWYRSGETERALKLLERLDALFGRGARPPNNQYVPTYDNLQLIVKEETYNAYQTQPWVAPSDVAASLQYGFKEGVLGGRPEVLRDALRFAADVTEYFKTNEFYRDPNKFGQRRIADTIGRLEDSTEIGFLQMMTAPGVTWEHRQRMWNGIDSVEVEVTGRPPMLRALVYDRVMPVLDRQFASHPMSQQFDIDQLFQPPPGLDQAREMLAKREVDRRKQQEEAAKRETIAHQ
jgi:hypothetical protein